MSKEKKSVEAYASPLNEEQYAHIGRIIVLFGHLETQIDLLIMILAGINKTYIFDVMVDNRSISSKADLLKELSEEYIPNGLDRATIDSTITEIKALVPMRNAIVHGQWGTLHKKIPGSLIFDKNDPGQPASKIKKNPKNPFLAKRLPEVSQRINDVLNLLIDVTHGENTPRPISILFSATSPTRLRSK